MRALAYARTDPALPERSPRATAALADSFERYCAANGHTAQGRFYDHVASEALPRYREMLETVRRTGLAYLVVVPSVEHLGATLEQQVGCLLELDALGCRVQCEDAEMPDPLQAAARLWQDQSGGARRRAVREGMKARAALGLGLGRPPYGYRIGPDGLFHQVPDEAEVVRSIFATYVGERVGVREIARRLNAEGVRTRRGRTWSMVTVRDILRNPVYIGTYQRFGLRMAGTYRSIVDPEVFRRAQEQMQGRSPGRWRQRSEPFLLTGLLYCGACRQRMMGVTRHRAWRRRSGERVQGTYRYYQCLSQINGRGCSYQTRRAEALEEEVVGLVTWSTGEVVAAEADQGTAERERASAEARLRAIDLRFVELVQRTAEGALTLAQLRGAMEMLEADRGGARARIAMTQADAGQLRQWRARQRERLENDWPGMSLTERRSVLRALVARVAVLDGRVEMVLLG